MRKELIQYQLKSMGRISHHTLIVLLKIIFDYIKFRASEGEHDLAKIMDELSGSDNLLKRGQGCDSHQTPQAYS